MAASRQPLTARLARVLRRFDLRALHVVTRLIPDERRRIFGLTLVIGVVCGGAAVAFHLTILLAEWLLIDRAIAAPSPLWLPLTIGLPAVGGLICGILLTFVVPDARGSGIPQVKVAYVINGGVIPLRVAIGKFVIGALQIGSGASLGREGPTVQICAGIASWLGRAAALSRRTLPQLLPIGGAAGIAAAFNAPLAAVTFVIEEIVGDLDHTVLAGIIVAAALAAWIERSVLGAHAVFDVPAGYGLHHASSLVLYFALGIAAAVVAVLFADGLLICRRYFQRLRIVPLWGRPAVGGLLTGLLAATAVGWLHTGGITGAGYDTLAAALSGSLSVRILVALLVFKALATICSYSSGGAGGLFAPTLFLGGMLGGVVGHLDVALLGHSQTEIGAFALVGMGALFAGLIRAPITSVLIIFEMTGSYELILPLMLANMTAYALARRWRANSIYEALLAQDGIRLPHGRISSHALDTIRVADAMASAPLMLPAGATVATALALVAEQPQDLYPVLAPDGTLRGVVSDARLRRTLAEHGDVPLETVANQQPPVVATEPLSEALLIMDRLAVRQVAVVDDAATRRVVGMLSLGDVIRAQAHAVRAARGEPAAPQLSEVAETLAREPAFRQLPAFSAVPVSRDDTTDALNYVQVVLDDRSPASGCTVQTLGLPPGVLLVTIERGGASVVPHGATVLHEGDAVTVFAPRATLPAALEILIGRGTP